MNQIEQGLVTQIMLGPEQAPLTPGDVVAAGREEAWMRTLLALTEDAGLPAAWARAVSVDEESWDAAGRAAWVQAEIDEVDEQIDEWLAAAEAGLEGDEVATRRASDVLDALARTGIGWGGEAMAELFPASDVAANEAVTALARVAGVGAPDALRAALHETEVIDNVVTFLRSAALSGAGELWDQFLIWHNRLDDIDWEEQDQALNDRIEGIGACLDPVLFARGLIGGDYQMKWASESGAVADFLQAWGATDWLEVVGLLEHGDSSTFETGAVIAASASKGIGESRPDDEQAEALFELLGYDLGADDGDDEWEPLASELGLQFPVAVGASVDATDVEVTGSFGGLLAQIAAHERLVVHGIHSPGVPGLPLSATSTEYIDLEVAESAVRELADSVLGSGEEAGGEVIRAVRTLCDAATWYRRDSGTFESLVRAACEAFEPVSSDAIQLARFQIVTMLDDVSLPDRVGVDNDVARALGRSGALATGRELDDQVVETLGALADGESVAALDAARRLGLGDGRAAQQKLGELWVDGPLQRGVFYRQVLLESLQV
jgi:hypothetical protein